MQLRPEHLAAQLDGAPAPVYLVTGDEPLLVQECADQIRAAARARGFAERQTFEVDGRQFDWGAPLAEAGARSLFAERKVLELRLATAKPGESGGTALAELCRRAGDELLLLVIAPRLDRAAQRSGWVKACDQAGVWIQVWPVGPGQLPAWIAGRLRRAGISASRPALELLAQRVEGNLLAAAQEIEKLRLLAPAGKLDADTISMVVADSARFNLFELIDRALSGDAHSACRSLRGLREEGVEPTLVCWALIRDLRVLARASRRRGTSLDRTLAGLGVWEARRPLFRAAAARLDAAQAELLLRQLGAIDRAVKGLRDASPWDDLQDVLLALCGRSAIHPLNLQIGLDSGHP
jgi:DNA polymerase III subunit delta